MIAKTIGSLKKHLGGTRLWRAANLALFHLNTNRLARKARSLAPPRWVYRKLQSESFYDRHYFDFHKDVNLESGYAAGYGDKQDFHEMTALVRDTFRAERVLEAGCAKGYQVRALREAGVEAWGFDLSAYAIETAPEDTRPWLKVGDCRNMGYGDSSFDLLLILETLEHVAPTELDVILDEVRRVASRWVLATMPCDGRTHFGPGHAWSEAGPLPPFYEPTVDLWPFRSLPKDCYGYPHHGHISIASRDYWTELFSRHGFARRGAPEREVYEGIESAREGLMIPFVFEKAVDGAGAATRLETREAGWREDGGVWSSRPLELPAGNHLLRVELRRAEPSPPRGARQRCLHVRAISTDGDTLHGTRLLDRRRLRALGVRQEPAVWMHCAMPRPGEVAVQLQGEYGLRLDLSAGILCRLHAMGSGLYS